MASRPCGRVRVKFQSEVEVFMQPMKQCELSTFLFVRWTITINSLVEIFFQ